MADPGDHDAPILVITMGRRALMIAQNIAHNAVLKGHSALLIMAAQLLNDFAGQESSRALERRLHFYCQSTTVLCVDEIDYLNYENRAADLLCARRQLHCAGEV